MSFILHKDCGQVPVVNGEERRDHRLCTPTGVPLWGYIGLVQV